ncbi:MAG: aminoglycoside phosphotransferase family protein, partial [Armatimonadota bacterium]
EGDETTGTVLMERVFPGTPLSKIDGPDRDSYIIIRDQVRKLREVSPEGYPGLETYLNCDDPLVKFMLASQRDSVFLHGDLHHENVLLGKEGWVTIDPKGLRGDRAFEAAAFIRNPIPAIASWPDLNYRLRERINAWSKELESEPWRIWGWALCCLRDGESVPGSHWDVVRDELEKLWPDEVPVECR